ncbi:septin-12 isoform X2 [Prionailurus iriomotensis]
MLGYVGIEAVLDQLKIKAMKMGFEFNIMVMWSTEFEKLPRQGKWTIYNDRQFGSISPSRQSGLGKSTMLNTLFKSKVWQCTPPGLEMPTPQTLQLKSVTHVIEEKGVKLKLTVTDTPGFGDQINNDKCWNPILGYINEQYERYLQEEILITRQRHIPDTRVHCCVYFVPPTGHCLRPLDIEFLQRLCRTVNVVPVIARADSLTLEEREAFRRRIQHNLRTHCIEVYPQKCFDEDINDRILNSKIRLGESSHTSGSLYLVVLVVCPMSVCLDPAKDSGDRIPFAVVGADRQHLVNGRCVLGRKTKWGVIEVENMAHCEFPLLRDLLIRSHLQDLKDITHNVHYENYRVCRLNESHVLPHGPCWVNLAPTPPGPSVVPGPSKVCRQAREDSDDNEDDY